MTEQNRQDLRQESVQTLKNGAEKPKKKRSQSDKFGTNKYTQVLVKRGLVKLDKLDIQMRWVLNVIGRLPDAGYSQAEVERFTVQDDVDKEIIQRLLEVGVNGALPKDVAAEVNKRSGYDLEYYEVSRRLVRLNKRMYLETGKIIFEKRGHRWALNKLGIESYGAGDGEALPNVNSLTFDNEEEG